jgi:hypothetical protein
MINLVFFLCTQDDFIVWEGEPTGRGKDRHLFLFKNKLLLTRKKKPENPGELPTYEYRGMIDVSLKM